METPIKLVVFDMAGTTVNENNLVYHSLLLTIIQHGFECTLEDVLEHGAGKEKRNAIAAILHATQEDQQNEVIIDAIFKDFLLNLELAYQHAVVTPQPNSETVFQQLKARKIAVVLNTGYDSKTANNLLDKLNWVKGVHYDLLITASDVTNSRPHPDMIFKAMSELNITDASTVIKIGDSVVDIEEGKNANCGLTIGITTGAQTATQLDFAKPDFILNNLNELIGILNS